MNDDLKTRLTELGLTGEQIEKLAGQGVTSGADMAMLNEAEIRGITGCTVIAGKKVAAAFVPAPVAVPVETVSTTPPSLDTLPSVPDDASFIEMLKVGGVLKVDRVDVMSAMKAAIAAGVGLFNLPDILRDRMEQFATEQEEPVGESFYRLERLITQRSYGDILAAFGTTGNFMSERRKKEVLQRLNAELWPALRGFNDQLAAWSDTWAKGMANPAMALTMLAMSQTGVRGGVMPPGMMQVPETAGLRDEAEAVVNRINKVFAGTGIPVARALAYDATRIKGILEEPTLLAAVGAATKDQMLKMLNVSVGADYVRLERNVTRFALAIMELPNVASGNEEYAYLGAMLTLGASIPWDKLGNVAGRDVHNGLVSSKPPPRRSETAYVRGDSVVRGDSDEGRR